MIFALFPNSEVAVRRGIEQLYRCVRVLPRNTGAKVRLLFEPTKEKRRKSFREQQIAKSWRPQRAAEAAGRVHKAMRRTPLCTLLQML